MPPSMSARSHQGGAAPAGGSHRSPLAERFGSPPEHHRRRSRLGGAEGSRSRKTDCLASGDGLPRATPRQPAPPPPTRVQRVPPRRARRPPFDATKDDE